MLIMIILVGWFDSVAVMPVLVLQYSHVFNNSEFLILVLFYLRTCDNPYHLTRTVKE